MSFETTYYQLTFSILLQTVRSLDTQRYTNETTLRVLVRTECSSKHNFAVRDHLTTPMWHRPPLVHDHAPSRLRLSLWTNPDPKTGEGSTRRGRRSESVKLRIKNSQSFYLHYKRQRISIHLLTLRLHFVNQGLCFLNRFLTLDNINLTSHSQVFQLKTETGIQYSKWGGLRVHFAKESPESGFWKVDLTAQGDLRRTGTPTSEVSHVLSFTLWSSKEEDTRRTHDPQRTSRPSKTNVFTII